jgi:hypothetical protein
MPSGPPIDQEAVECVPKANTMYGQWNDETVNRRLDRCRLALWAWGLIDDDENNRLRSLIESKRR